MDFLNVAPRPLLESLVWRYLLQDVFALRQTCRLLRNCLAPLIFGKEYTDCVFFACFIRPLVKRKYRHIRDEALFERRKQALATHVLWVPAFEEYDLGE